MKKIEGYVYMRPEFAARARRRTIGLFVCLLLIPAVFLVLLFLVKGFGEVFIVAASASFLADVLLVLVNGLCRISRCCFAVTGSTLRIRNGYCGRKFAVVRYSDIYKVQVRRYFRKKDVAGDVCVYEGKGRSALRYLSEADAVYDICLYGGSGDYKLKYLTQTEAAAVLSYFEDVYDGRGYAKSE